MAQTNGKRQKTIMVGGIQSWADCHYGDNPGGIRTWSYEIGGFMWQMTGEFNYVMSCAKSYAAKHNAEYIVLVAEPVEIV